MVDRILVVEGEEDFHLFRTLLRLCGLSTAEREVKVLVCEPAGKFNALETFWNNLELPLQIASRQTQIGLVVDADFETHGTGHAATVQKINAKARELDLNPLLQPGTGAAGYELKLGTDSKTKVGVWVMPDCASDGYTEHLLHDAVNPVEQLRFEYAKQACQTALAHPTLEFPVKDHHHTKAELDTWLAWQSTPRMQFGKAFDEFLFNIDNPQMQPLISWLNWLYTS
jgi:hypothetical protein